MKRVLAKREKDVQCPNSYDKHWKLYGRWQTNALSFSITYLDRFLRLVQEFNEQVTCQTTSRPLCVN